MGPTAALHTIIAPMFVSTGITTIRNRHKRYLQPFPPGTPRKSSTYIILTTQLCFVTFCHVLFKIYPVFTNTVTNCKFFKKIYKNFFNESISTVECGFIYKLQPTINLLYSSEMYSGIGTVLVVATLGATLFSL